MIAMAGPAMPNVLGFNIQNAFSKTYEVHEKVIEVDVVVKQMICATNSAIPIYVGISKRKYAASMAWSIIANT